MMQQFMKWLSTDKVKKFLRALSLVCFSLVISVPFVIIFVFGAIYGFSESQGPSPQLTEEKLVYSSVFVGILFLFINSIAVFAASKVHAIFVIPSAISYYLVTTIIFAQLFWLGGCISEIDPETGEYASYIYFSYVTWTNLGYGDLAPTGLCRPISVAVVSFGHVSLAILTGVIVAIVFNSRLSGVDHDMPK